ncbi:hypothetical protein [Serratia proteamaculans]|uniref:hypothetical protein n=1 Tax=Serratia proteamaculans TaxID=28151 RepID=UPI0021780440|nr:hypothetical protein [Serratia proteamaculans]CAI0713717.1 Uncharacterised protein [Serratia proteamaculans]
MNKLKCSRHDNDLNVIANHNIVPFSELHGGGGYAIRVIEIYRLHKMEADLKQFEQLTGYEPPRANCTAQEIHSLIDQGEKVCFDAESKVSDIENEIMLCERELGNAKRGVSDISRWNGNMKEAIVQANANLERANAKLVEAKAAVAARRGLLGLLREPLEQMLMCGEKGFKGKVLTHIPLEPLPAHTYRKGAYSEGLRSHIYAWKLMDTLENALREIIQRCTPPTDKHALNHGGLERALCAVQYYNASGEKWRDLMTVGEYTDLMMGEKLSLKSKQQEMCSPL